MIAKPAATIYNSMVMVKPTSPAESPRLEIEAVLGKHEQPLANTATRLLSECLEAGSGGACAIKLAITEAVRSDLLNPSGPGIPAELHAQKLVPPGVRDYRGSLYQKRKKIVVLSLLADVVQPALRHRSDGYLFFPVAQWKRTWTPEQRQWVKDRFVEEPVIKLDWAACQWRAICTGALQAGATHIFLCNVFRRVRGLAHRYQGTPESLRERIQRFNLLAAEISHETGACVVDLDRALADIGGRVLHTDYRLKSEAAAVAGADTLVSTMFRAGLDEYLAPALQEKTAALFEARRVPSNWFLLQRYKKTIDEMVASFQALGQSPEAGTDKAQHLGEFLLRHAIALGKVAPHGSLALHRQFVGAIQESGEGYVELARALTVNDIGLRERARQRIKTGAQRLNDFWKAFDEYCQRNSRSAS
jgi:hypothetical protein